MRIYTLYKVFTATLDNGASVTMVKAGTIVAIQFASAGVLDATAELYQVELSTVPILQSTTNDSQGALATVREECVSPAGATAGMSVGGVNISYPCAMRIEAGEKLYLNALLTGTTSVKVSCLVHVR